MERQLNVKETNKNVDKLLQQARAECSLNVNGA